MGSCQCTTTNQLPDLQKMALSKMSTGESFGQNYRQTNNSNLGKSMMVSQSMVKSRLHKVVSNEDYRMDSALVRSTYKGLPATDASRFRDLMIPEDQLYIDALAAKYVGELQSQKPHGYGKLYFDNGDFMEGVFVDGRCEGKGRFIKKDGSHYDGDLKNNVADGYGIYISKKGFRYEGQWKNNMPNGSGEATYPNTSRYVGEFLNNKKNGKGTLYQGGNVYRGEFKNDLFQGKLKYEGQNGQIYDGEWKASQKHGYGVYQWPDGSRYQGQYSEGKKDGKGKMIYPNGETYDGEWKQGNKHGKGSINSEKRNFNGVWRNGDLKEVVA